MFDDDDESGEEMMLSLDEALQTALDSFRDAVIQQHALHSTDKTSGGKNFFLKQV